MALFLQGTVIDYTALIAILAITFMGLLALYAAMRRAIRQNTEQLRCEFEQRLNVVITKARLTEPITVPQQVSPQVAMPPAVAPPPMVKSVTLLKEPAEEITPETLLVIAAAVTAYLGKAVRIRSARMLYSHENFNAWSQQGRAVIQASHNLAQRGY